MAKRTRNSRLENLKVVSRLTHGHKSALKKTDKKCSNRLQKKYLLIQASMMMIITDDGFQKLI